MAETKNKIKKGLRKTEKALEKAIDVAEDVAKKAVAKAGEATKKAVEKTEEVTKKTIKEIEIQTEKIVDEIKDLKAKAGNKIKQAEKNVSKEVKQVENKISKEVKQISAPKETKVEGVFGLIQFKDWEKIDLRVAKIKKVEDIEGADKLYKLTLDVGELGQKVACAGIKQHYKKDELKGKKLIYFANITPRMMKGINSEGMVLAAVTKNDSEVVLIAPEKDIAVGARVS